MGPPGHYIACPPDVPGRNASSLTFSPDALFPPPRAAAEAPPLDTKQAIHESQAEVVPQRVPLKPVSAVPPMIRSPVHLGVLNKRMKEGARAEALSRGHTAERRLRDDDGRRPPSRRCLARPHHFAPASYQEGGDGTTPSRISLGSGPGATAQGRAMGAVAMRQPAGLMDGDEIPWELTRYLLLRA